MQAPGKARKEPHDPKATRIAVLAREYVIATSRRRNEIGEEIAGLMSGRLPPPAQTDRAA